MGDVKNNMKTSDKTDKKGGSILGSILPKKSRPQDAAQTSRTFADTIKEADETLGKLIIKKQSDLEHEGAAARDQNQISLSRLRAMQFHIDEVINLAYEYGQGS